MTAERNWVEEVGAPAYASIVEMVAALECDYDRLEELRDERDEDAEELDELELAELETAAGECADADEARQRIEKDVLSVEVRSGWTTPGEPMEAEEFCILLTTGGPAVRIRGELDEHNEPYRAWLEVQECGEPWTKYFPANGDTLLTYARCFYFGE